jgi:hypothetical protein
MRYSEDVSNSFGVSGTAPATFCLREKLLGISDFALHERGLP